MLTKVLVQDVMTLWIAMLSVITLSTIMPIVNEIMGSIMRLQRATKLQRAPMVLKRINIVIRESVDVYSGGNRYLQKFW